MVIQYPDTVTIKNSNWSNNTEGQITYKGRKESGASARKDFNDPIGSVNCVVFMPLPVETIAIGTTAEVYDKDGQFIIADTVKQFSRGQLNARIWL